jgi:HSP20 family protein
LIQIISRGSFQDYLLSVGEAHSGRAFSQPTEVNMNITRFNPFRDLDEIFSWPRLGQGNDIALQNMTRADWVPAVDVNESDEEFLITVEVPQVEKDDIKIEVQNGMLNIKGERKYENDDKKAHRIERFYGSFQRSFRLPDNVEEENIHADFKNGMLYVNLPKLEKELPATHEITIN